MNEYIITFAVELSNEKLDNIEANCNIPTKIGFRILSLKWSSDFTMLV